MADEKHRCEIMAARRHFLLMVLLSEEYFYSLHFFTARCSHHEGHEEDWRTKRLTALSYTFLLKLV